MSVDYNTIICIGYALEYDEVIKMQDKDTDFEFEDMFICADCFDCQPNYVFGYQLKSIPCGGVFAIDMMEMMDLGNIPKMKREIEQAANKLGRPDLVMDYAISFYVINRVS